MNTIKIVLFAMMAFSTSIVYALDFSATIKREGAIESKQYCYTTFEINQNGEWSAFTKFSNGKTLDGDHFAARMEIYSRSGQKVAFIDHRAGMNPTHGFGTRERVVPEPKDRGRIDPAVVSTIDESKTKYWCFKSHDRIDDEFVGFLIKSVVFGN